MSEEYVAGPPRASGAWHRKPGTRRYEINYTDSTGKLRWKTVEGGVREVRSARAEIIATHFLDQRRRVRRLSKDRQGFS